MYLSRFISVHIEVIQTYAWMKPSSLPSYLPYIYRGIIAFATVNALLLLVVHFLIKRRLEAFAREASRQFQPIKIRI